MITLFSEKLKEFGGRAKELEPLIVGIVSKRLESFGKTQEQREPTAPRIVFICGVMRITKAQLDAIGHWFLEVSALLAVFPWLDQLIHNSEAFNWKLLLICTNLVLILIAVGLYCIQGDHNNQ